MATQLVGHLPESVFASYCRCLFLIYTFFYSTACCSPALTDCSGRGKKKKKIHISGVSVGRWVGWGVTARKRGEDRKDLL